MNLCHSCDKDSNFFFENSELNLKIFPNDYVKCRKCYRYECTKCFEKSQTCIECNKYNLCRICNPITIIDKCIRCFNYYCKDNCKDKIHNFKEGNICYKCVKNKGKSEFHNPCFCIVCYKRGKGKKEEIKMCKLCKASYCKECEFSSNKLTQKKNFGTVCKFCVFNNFSPEIIKPDKIFICDVKGCKNTNYDYFFSFKKFKKLQKICSYHYCDKNAIIESDTEKYCDIMLKYYPVKVTKKCVTCENYFYKTFVKKGQCIPCYLACVKIQKWWFKIYWDPTSKTRIRILNSQYEESYL